MLDSFTARRSGSASRRTPRSRTARGAVLALVAAAAVVAVQTPASAATIGPTRSATDLATAVADSLPPGALTGSSLPVIPPPPDLTAECANGIDDDGDGLVDFAPPVGETADPDCTSATDNQEDADQLPECSNTFDDDGDGFTDFVPPDGETADPGCSSAMDNNESDGDPDPTAACADGQDNDGDGTIDFTPPVGETADPGCTSATDLDESSEGLPLGVDSNPAAVGSSPLAGFPTSGNTYTILSSGNTLFADDPNDSSGTSQGNNGGGGTHGGSFEDLVTLRMDLAVPAGANCLSLDFRFLSEEFPEFVGSSFNDGFIAELDGSDFTADAANVILAPRNFAFDATGKVVSINTAGFSEAEAAGTTYDGSTPLLRASTPITPGAHAVYLSVFDQGDSALDSTAFVDHLRLFTAPAGACIAGATDDITPPDTTITGGPTGTTGDNTPTFTFTSTEPGTFQCRVDAGVFASCTTPFTTSALSDGPHTFEVRAIDLAGNVDLTPASRSFTVSTIDNTPPDTTITAGPSGSTNDNTPTFSFTATEAGSTFECRVDAAAFAACTTPFTTAALSEGPHTFEVRATDAALNTDLTPASRSFTVDTAAPDTTITAGPTGTTNDSTPTFSFTATEVGSTFQCRVDAAAFATCTTPFTTGALSDGAHTFEVRATDAAGNTDPTPASRSFTVDTTPPDTTITAGPSGTTTDSTPTFSFTATEAGSTFECKVDAGAFASCTTPFTTAVLSDGAHTFTVRATDAVGNTDATPASRSFTVDTTAPDTTITAGPSGTTSDNTPTFSFTATEAGSTFECKVDAGAFVSCTTPFTTAVLADGAHTFTVRATDAVGNTDATPASRSFTVNTSDLTPPDTAITAGPSGTTNDSTPTFSFTATEAGSTFECRVDAAAFASCTTPFTTAALADGAHTFEVRATDGVGNTDLTPASRSFTVDTTPPDTTITSGPPATTDDTTPTFAFTGTAGTTSFECRVDAAAFASCTTPFTTATLALGAHTFAVRAVDGVGNIDATPATASFTISSPPPPTYTCQGKKATIVGTEGDDVLSGTGGNDVIVGLGGRDKISGGGGKDIICGGDGKDVIDGAAGKDAIEGGTGADKVTGGGGNDEIDGGDGNDRLSGNGGDDTLLGGAGDDELTGAAGDDELVGGGGDDELSGDGGNDSLVGGGGNDHLDGGAGRDHGDGGPGNDVIVRCET